MILFTWLPFILNYLSRKTTQPKSTNLQYFLPGLRENLLHLLFVGLLQGGDGRLVFIVFGVQSVNHLADKNIMKGSGQSVQQ